MATLLVAALGSMHPLREKIMAWGAVHYLNGTMPFDAMVNAATVPKFMAVIKKPTEIATPYNINLCFYDLRATLLVTDDVCPASSTLEATSGQFAGLSPPLTLLVDSVRINRELAVHPYDSPQESYAYPTNEKNRLMKFEHATTKRLFPHYVRGAELTFNHPEVQAYIRKHVPMYRRFDFEQLCDLYTTEDKCFDNATLGFFSIGIFCIVVALWYGLEMNERIDRLFHVSERAARWERAFERMFPKKRKRNKKIETKKLKKNDSKTKEEAKGEAAPHEKEKEDMEKEQSGESDSPTWAHDDEHKTAPTQTETQADDASDRMAAELESLKEKHGRELASLATEFDARTQELNKEVHTLRTLNDQMAKQLTELLDEKVALVDEHEKLRKWWVECGETTNCAQNIISQKNEMKRLHEEISELQHKNRELDVTRSITTAPWDIAPPTEQLRRYLNFQFSSDNFAMNWHMQQRLHKGLPLCELLRFPLCHAIMERICLDEKSPERLASLIRTTIPSNVHVCNDTVVFGDELVVLANTRVKMREGKKPLFSQS